MMALWRKECKFFKKIMTKYEQFLNSCSIISEKEFNEVIDSLPEIDFNLVNISDDGLYLQCDLAESIISYILDVNWDYVYIEDVDFDNKEIEINDVETIEDLEEIKNTFPKWTIKNYDELKNEIENGDSSILNKIKLDLFKNNIDKISIEQLREIIDNEQG